MATHAHGISARQLWKQLGLGSYKSAWLLLRKLRRAMVDPERERLLLERLVAANPGPLGDDALRQLWTALLALMTPEAARLLDED